MRCHHLLQLDNRQILPVLLTVAQTLVIFLDCQIDRLKFLCGCLYCVDIIIRYIIIRTQILADNPFHQCLRHLTDPVIDKPQKIPRRNIFPVELQAAPQRDDRTGHVPDLSLAQAVVIPVIRLIYDLLRVIHLYPPFCILFILIHDLF